MPVSRLQQLMRKEPIAFDSILDLCQNQHRRIILATLAEEQRSLTLNDLTEAIFNYTQQTPPIEASEDVFTEIRLKLYHVHLPKLAADGFIRHDTEHGLVEPTKKLEQALPALSTILAASPSKAPLKR